MASQDIIQLLYFGTEDSFILNFLFVQVFTLCQQRVGERKQGVKITWPLCMTPLNLIL
jgi:hypothetical protein